MTISNSEPMNDEHPKKNYEARKVAHFLKFWVMLHTLTVERINIYSKMCQMKNVIIVEHTMYWTGLD